MSDNNRICELYQKKAKELIDSRFSKNLKNSGVTVSATSGQPVAILLRYDEYRLRFRAS